MVFTLAKRTPEDLQGYSNISYGYHLSLFGRNITNFHGSDLGRIEVQVPYTYDSCNVAFRIQSNYTPASAMGHTAEERIPLQQLSIDNEETLLPQPETPILQTFCTRYKGRSIIWILAAVCAISIVMITTSWKTATLEHCSNLIEEA